MKTFQQLQQETKRYHKNLYKTNILFNKGTWLEKPEEVIIELVDTHFINKKRVSVLDLGSGVGRNAIPIALKIAKNEGHVTCVDFLDIAIEKLNEYAKKFHVEEAITGHVSPIKQFEIKPSTYDFIIAHGSLEHVKNKDVLSRIISDMANGTKLNGINYVCISTNLHECDHETRKEFPLEMELPLETEEAKRTILKRYHNWDTIKLKVWPYVEEFKKQGRMFYWSTDFLTIVVQKKEAV